MTLQEIGSLVGDIPTEPTQSTKINYAVLTYSREEVTNIFAAFGGRFGRFINSHASAEGIDVFYESFDEPQDEIVRVVDAALAAFAHGQVIAFDTETKLPRYSPATTPSLSNRITTRYSEGMSYVQASVESTVELLLDFPQAYPQLAPALKILMTKSAASQGTIMAMMISFNSLGKGVLQSLNPGKETGFQDHDPTSKSGRECAGMKFSRRIISENNDAKERLASLLDMNREKSERMLHVRRANVLIEQAMEQI